MRQLNLVTRLKIVSVISFVKKISVIYAPHCLSHIDRDHIEPFAKTPASLVALFYPRYVYRYGLRECARIGGSCFEFGIWQGPRIVNLVGLDRSEERCYWLGRKTKRAKRPKVVNQLS